RRADMQAVPEIDPNRKSSALRRWGRHRFFLDEFFFLFLLIPVRGYAQLARFFDWFLIDGLVTAFPSGLLKVGYSIFGPIRRQGAWFYFCAAVGGVVTLAVL